MQIKLLERVVEDVAGKPAASLVQLLAGKEDVNEFLIAKKMELTINQVRNLLYKLSDFGMVSFIRKKDKRKGWYIYFWTLDIFKSLEVLEKKLLQEKASLEGQLKSRKTKRFYTCKVCGVELSEESALNHFFTCQECGNVYEILDDEKALKEMRSKLERLNEDLEIIMDEKEKQQQKLNKERTKISKKFERDKKRKKAQKKSAKKKIAMKKPEEKSKKKTKNPKGKKTKEKKIKKKKSAKKSSKKKAKKKRPKRRRK